MCIAFDLFVPELSIPTFLFPGLHQLKEQLNRNLDLQTMITLCVREDEQIRVICFELADTLSTFADKFNLMNQKYPSDLFTREWKAAMAAVDESITGIPLSLADIHCKVWEVSFRNCQSLLQQLHYRSIKLVDIDRHFRQHKGDLEAQLTNLFTAVNACLGEKEDGDWIREVVHHIHDYWHLCNHQKAACVFLDLKEALNLHTGDFRDVEILSTEV